MSTSVSSITQIQNYESLTILKFVLLEIQKKQCVLYVSGYSDLAAGPIQSCGSLIIQNSMLPDSEFKDGTF